jgi:8-oxo-dGTP diphosphatase
MADGSGEIMIVGAAALVAADGRVLVQRRPAGKALAGQWEFPGGKVERGEAPVAALARELKEELGIDVAPGACAPLAFAEGHAGERALLLLLYRVATWIGMPQPLHAPELRWASRADLARLPMPAADRPLIAALDAVLAG